jgi:hypothetical protein
MPDMTGWRIIRLSAHDDPGPSPGKRPLDTNWPALPPPTLDTVDVWLSDGCNIGVATGHGFVVVDIDLPEIPPEFSKTLTARSGRGWHLYYTIAHLSGGEGLSGIRNSAGKLGPHIDIRGDGGQVVIPPSMHASGKRYTWYADVPMAPLPAWVERAVALPGKWIELDWSKLDAPCKGWGRVALEREVAKVAGTAQGGRNDQLFKSAAALMEIVNGGNLGAEEVEDALCGAATTCGLDTDEIRRVLKSARTKVGTKARSPKPRAPAPAPSPVPDTMPEHLATVLVPGSHVTDHGEYLEVTPREFATVLLACQPRHTIFHRAGVAGVIRAGTFAALSPSGMRLALVANPYRWVTPKPTMKDPEPGPRKMYVPLAKEHAELAIARCLDHANVGEIRTISFAPTYLSSWALSKPGWNEGGIYQTGPALPAISPACLRDLLIDFPWLSEADRQNFIGLLVTILVRGAIEGNVPLHFIGSTVERTGKTKLVDVLVGLLFLGGPTPAMQFAGSDEERDKRVLAVLMLGLPIIHLDNIGEWFESAALASTITASVYSGRVLGQSSIVHVPNLAVWIGTGNNVAMSGEMAKRTVPIKLWPKDADPHLRTEFEHPDFKAFVLERREAILAALVAMVESWLAAGRPGSPHRIGGFEEWSAIVGGVMAHAGYTDWMANYADWTGSADVEGADMTRFMEDWQIGMQGGPQKTADLRKRASELGLFERRLGRSSSDRGQDTAFANLLRRYLKRAVNTSYGKFCVVEQVGSHGRLYAMERR